MCDLLGCLKSKLEVFGSGRLPCVDRLRARHPVKGVIDLDAVQFAGVILKKSLLRKPLGVEDRPPFLVTEPGCSEPNRRHSRIMAQALPKSGVNIESGATAIENTAKNGSFQRFLGPIFNSRAGVRIRCNLL